MLLFVRRALWSIIDDSGFVVSSVVSANPALLSFHMLAGNLDRALLLVRDGKGEKDRITMLPETLVAPLQEHLVRVKQLHTKDLAEGYGAVYLPYALER